MSTPVVLIIGTLTGIGHATGHQASVDRRFGALEQLALGNCWSFAIDRRRCWKLLSRKAAFISVWRPSTPK